MKHILAMQTVIMATEDKACGVIESDSYLTQQKPHLPFKSIMNQLSEKEARSSTYSPILDLWQKTNVGAIVDTFLTKWKSFLQSKMVSIF